jgi:20S proteasome subunit beta 2
MDGCGGIGNTIVNDNSDNYMDKMDNNKNNVGNKKEDENDTTCRIVSPSLTHDMIDNNTPLNYNDDDGSKLIPPPASVTAVLHYLRSQLRKSNGNLGVNLLVGGYDPLTSRALLAAIHPHGSIDIVSYSALGSGGLAAMGVLESRYPTRRSRRRRQQRKQDSTANADMSSSSSCMMTVAEGIQLAVDAVRAGIDNDLGSGSQVDVCVIGPGGVFYRRAVAREEELQWTSDNVNDDVVDGASISNSSAVLESSWKTAREVGQGSSSGVNGFGNIPFAIQSKKVVIGGRFSSSFDVDNNVKYKQGRSWLDEVIHMRTKK